MVWLAPWGDVAKAHPWRNIIVHQTEGPAGSARGGAQEQSKNPTRRGVMVWVETDGTVYWAVPENLVPTHTDGADRNDNKYIDNGPTYHQVNGDNSIGVEFAGNYPDVTRRRHRGADRGVADPGEGAARALRHSARARLCAQLDRLQGRALLRRLRAGDAGEAVGGVGAFDQIGCAIQRKMRLIRPGRPRRRCCAGSALVLGDAALVEIFQEPMSFGSVTVKLSSPTNTV